MPFSIIRQDITKMETDVIVNAANTELLMGGGVCGAIFKAAGADDLQKACRPLAPIKTGEAVITPGFKLPAKYVIHTAGPVYSGGGNNEAALLGACYKNSLELALENGCGSIAFPLISSGIFGYPKAEALKVATNAIGDFLEHNEMDAYLVVFDKQAVTVSEKLLGDVESYIDDHFVSTSESRRRELIDVERTAICYSKSQPSAPVKESVCSDYEPVGYGDESVAGGIDEWVGNLDEPFLTMLLRLIDAKGKTDVQVYKRANIDRKLFSKIRSSKDYMPSKRTAIALALALELTLDETDDLLSRAGYALSRSQKFDVIVEYFIVNGKYDIYEINEVLFQYDQPLLVGGF